MKPSKLNIPSLDEVNTFVHTRDAVVCMNGKARIW